VKYEYKVMSFQTGIIMQGKAMEECEQALNDLGWDSWELVAVIPMHARIGFSGSRCFLKRPIRE